MRYNLSQGTVLQLRLTWKHPQEIRAHRAWARGMTSPPVGISRANQSWRTAIISEWERESTRYCARWSNMTTSCGGVNGKKNKQGSQTSAPRFTLCGLRKWATLMSICTYDFYCSKQDPPPPLPGNHNTPNNAWLCEEGKKNKPKWIKSRFRACGAPQDEGTSCLMNVSVSDMWPEHVVVSWMDTMIRRWFLFSACCC